MWVKRNKRFHFAPRSAQEIILIFLLSLSLSNLNAQIEAPLFYPSAPEQYNQPSERPLHYLLADSVIVRKSSSKNSTALDLMRIGQAFVIDERSTVADTLNGIIANWYRISYGNQQGYIWGGFIALKAFGSHAQSKVRFYYGLSRANDTGRYPSFLAQIRAVQNGLLVAKREFLYHPSLQLPEHHGPCGLAVDDIFSWHLPCEGGCGCTTGDYYIFWDGKRFSEVYAALGTADAWASGGSRLIFPCSMEGEPGIIIRETDDFIDERPEGYLRFWSREYFILKNAKLVAAERAPLRKEYFAKN